MITRVLMINRQLAFAVAIKQALERTGAFEVHPFTTSDAAIEYLQGRTQDIALVDFTIPNSDGTLVVGQLRAVQPGIPVIGTPRQPDSVTGFLGLQASVNTPFSARDIIPVINGIIEKTGRASQSDPRGKSGTLGRSSTTLADPDFPPQAPPSTRPMKTRAPDLPEYTSLDNVLANMASRGQNEPEPRAEQFVEFVLKDTGTPPAEPPNTAFARLAAEEPPPPTFEESGTVHDLVTGVSDASFRNVLSLLRGEEVVEEEPVESYSDQELREAFSNYYDDVAIQRAQEKRPPEEGFNIDALLASINVTPPRDTRSKPPSQRFVFDDSQIIVPPEPALEDEPGSNTARIVLERALDESTPIDTFSIDDLLTSIERQLPPNRPKVKPLPSWVQESEQRSQDDERYVKEPEFLPPTLPEEIPQYDFDFAEQPTLPSLGQQVEENADSLATEWLEPTGHYFPDAPWLADQVPADVNVPPLTVPEFEPPMVEEDTQSYTRPLEPVTDAAPPPPTVPELPPSLPEFEPAPEPDAFVAPSFEDPRLAQLALALTQISLELTAEASILARDGEIVAYAGLMEREDIEELRQTIADDWEAQPKEARIRFVNLAGSGKEYMLYSRLTEDNLTLSLIFAGTTPLRDIRRQGKRIVEALQAVPEPESEAAPPEPLTPEELAMIAPNVKIETGALAPYAYVWVIRDPNITLNSAVARAIVSGMNVQLREKAWDIQDLRAREDYVYVLANVPGETPPYELIRDLKRRSAEIAHAQNPALNRDTLWADSYLVVTPGRQLDEDEIQQFINFERM
jgi:CheY-like chemotaxis protein/REP element-mobilizing transposase RayT